MPIQGTAGASAVVEEQHLPLRGAPNLHSKLALSHSIILCLDGLDMYETFPRTKVCMFRFTYSQVEQEFLQCRKPHLTELDSLGKKITYVVVL